MEIQKEKKIFMKYVSKYDIENADSQRKIGHTMRVIENSKKIAESLNLSKEEQILAMKIALLHDIGRFEQIKVYNKCTNDVGMDHGDYGVEVLKKDDYILEYVEKEDVQTVLKAVKNHNKFEIEKGLESRELLQTKIIKDADKLDILYQTNTIYWKKEGEIERLEEEKISEYVVNQIKNQKLINRKLCETELDEKMVYIGFIFDLNFKKSIEIVKEEKYIEKMLARFEFKNEETKERVKKIKRLAEEFLNKG